MTSYNKAILNGKRIIDISLIKRSLTHQDIALVLSDEGLVLGIDKLKVLFPVLDISDDPEDWGSFKRELGGLKPGGQVGTRWLPLGYAGFSVGHSTGRGSNGWVEFNPSKIDNEHGTLVGIDRAVEILAEVLGLTREFFTIRVTRDEFKILRLDLTVDFAPVADMEGLLGLAKKSRPFRFTKPNTVTKLQNDEMETITFATKSKSCVIFYDKSAKNKLKDPTFRVEVQAKRGDLLDVGPASLKDLNEQSIRKMFLHRMQPFIDLCSFTPTTQLHEIIQLKTDTDHLVRLAGYEYLENNGRKLSQTDHFLRKDSKFKKRWPHLSIKDLL